jgi:steroid 5-alpha reductase family enzyme
LPFLTIIQNPRPPFALAELAGMVIWIVAVGGEAVADAQLARFRGDPTNRTRVLRNGFWRYSRHPNYFFEWLHWWAYVVMTIGSPGWLLTWLAPLGMGWALLKVTGIPPAEQEAVARRGEEYRIYQETTSAFVPWFPRPRPTNRG